MFRPAGRTTIPISIICRTTNALSADQSGGRDGRYQDARSFGSGIVSFTISHRSELQALLSAFASLCRKTIISSGSNATTKSAPSRLMDTCLRNRRAVLRKDSTASSIDICDPTPPTYPARAYRWRSRCRSTPRVIHRPCLLSVTKRRHRVCRGQHHLRIWSGDGRRLSE